MSKPAVPKVCPPAISKAQSLVRSTVILLPMFAGSKQKNGWVEEA